MNSRFVFLLTAMALSWAAGVRGADSDLAAKWDFDSEEPLPIMLHGEVVRDQPGPRPPEFPDLDPGNTAVQLKGNGSRIEIRDPGAGSRERIRFHEW
jgi:hypothetical protein